MSVDLTNLAEALDTLDLPPALPGETLHPQDPGNRQYWFDPNGNPLTGDTREQAEQAEAHWTRLGGGFRTALSVPGRLNIDRLGVSTAYLMISTPSFAMPLPPRIWETQVLGPGVEEGWTYSYCTEAAARAGHEQIVALLTSLGLAVQETT